MNLLLSIEEKTRLTNYSTNISMERVSMNTGNRRTNEPHRFVLNLPQRLDLKNLDKHVALEKLSIY